MEDFWNYRRKRSLSEINILSNNIAQSSAVKSVDSYFNFSEPDSKTSLSYEEKPYIFKAIYQNDLNLIQLHNTIRAKIVFEKREIPQICEQISKFRQEMYDEKIPINIHQIKKKIESLEEFYHNIVYGKLWENYVEESRPILEEYTKIMSKNTQGIIVIGDSSFEESPEIIEKRCFYISKYLQVIENLGMIECDVTRLISSSLICNVCGNIIDAKEPNEDGLYLCSCGYAVNSLYRNCDCKESNTSSITDAVSAFTKWLSKYEGKSNETIPEEMFDKFDKWCVENGYQKGSVVIESSLNPPLSLLIRIMGETGYSKYFSIKNKIRHLYWNWKLPILSQSEICQAIQHFNETQIVFDENKGSRKSNINMEIRGYQILRSINHLCFREDFKFPISTETIEYVNNLSEIMTAKTGIFIPKIES
jgi:hypothetical protein